MRLRTVVTIVLGTKEIIVFIDFQASESSKERPYASLIAKKEDECGFLRFLGATLMIKPLKSLNTRVCSDHLVNVQSHK